MATALDDAPAARTGRAPRTPRPRGEKKLPLRDRLVVITMVAIPTLLVVGILWVET